jgi:hypothetical protein
MAVLPVAHFEWQVLRAVRRSRKPAPGRTLRLAPTRRTRDGAFLTNLVESGLLKRVTGTPDTPFDATYALTELGEHAAEYGECDRPYMPRPVGANPESTKPARKGRALAVGK